MIRTMIILLVLIPLSCIIGLIITPNVGSGPISIQNRVHEVYHALYSYTQDSGSFPKSINVDPDTGQLISWRTLILSYFGYSKNAFDPPGMGCPWPYTHQIGEEWTSIVAVTGEKTVWSGKYRLAEFKGYSEDLMLLAVIEKPSIRWYETQDLNLDVNVSGTIERLGVTHVLFADGSVWRLDKNCPLKHLQTLSSFTSISKTSREQLLSSHRLDL